MALCGEAFTLDNDSPHSSEGSIGIAFADMKNTGEYVKRPGTDVLTFLEYYQTYEILLLSNTILKFGY